MVNKIRLLRAIFRTAYTARMDTVAMLPSAFILWKLSIGIVSSRDQVIQVAAWRCNNTDQLSRQVNLTRKARDLITAVMKIDENR